MPNGIKMLKFLGGIVEVCFILSFVYEIGREAERREQREIIAKQTQSESQFKMKELIDILKRVDKNAVDKARFVTVK